MESKPWLDLYPKEIPATLDYSTEPLQEYLINTARTSPEKSAIHFMGKEMTYKQLYDETLSLASYLQNTIGIQKGDRVAIMLPNTPQAVISYFGILMAGGIVVQTNPLYTERELEYQMQDAGAIAIITLDILYPRVTKVMPQTQLQNIVVTAIKDYLPFPKNLVYPFIQKKQYGIVVKVKHEGSSHLFTEIVKTNSKSLIQHEFMPDEDIALLQYTGGTTGFPKGVMLTHKNLIANTCMSEAWLYKCKPGQESILGILPSSMSME